MKYKILALITATALSLSLTAPAHAVVYNFNLSGSRTANFQIDTAATPSFSSESFIGKQVQYSNVAGNFGGTTGTATVGFGTFLVATLNIQNASLGFTQFAGPELFTGPAASPTFLTGTFNLTSIGSGNSTLVITQASGAVPEPAAWAMMITGFGLVGYSMRRRSVHLQTA